MRVFFEAGTKRRLDDEEISMIPWRDLELNILCRMSSMLINGGGRGPQATPDAIMLKRNDLCPFADDELASLE